MGLWARIKRVFRAGTGAALDKMENPEMVLQQTIRDMRDRVPELNNSVAQVMATERLLAKNRDRLDEQVVDLDSKIKASVKMGPRRHCDGLYRSTSAGAAGSGTNDRAG